MPRRVRASIAEMKVALGAALEVLVQRFFPDDLPAAFALQPQAFGADAAFLFGGIFLDAGFFPREPRHGTSSVTRRAYLTAIRSWFARFPSTVRMTSSAPRPARLRGRRRLTWSMPANSPCGPAYRTSTGVPPMVAVTEPSVRERMPVPNKSRKV